MTVPKLELGISALSHLLWGLHPVLSRYLQTRPTPPLDGLNLLAIGQCLALSINLLSTAFATCNQSSEGASSSTYHSAPLSGHAAPTEFPSQNIETGENPAETSPSLDFPDRQLAYDEEDGSNEPLSFRNEAPPSIKNIQSSSSRNSSSSSSSGSTGSSSSKSAECVSLLQRPATRLALLFGCMAALRAGTNIESSRFTSAVNVQMVAMAGPLITALASSALLREAVPWTLWPALLVAGSGEALVLAAQAGLVSSGHPSVDSSSGSGSSGSNSGSSDSSNSDASNRNNSGSSGSNSGSSDSSSGNLTGRDVLGLGLQLASLLFSGVARVVMKASEKDFSASELMVFQYTCTALPALGWSFLGATAAGPTGTNVWEAWAQLTLTGWSCFATLVLGVMVSAATLQVRAVRFLGPAGHASLQPIRLFATLAAAYFLLNERVTQPAEWVGLVIVLAALGWYVTVGRALGTKTSNKASSNHDSGHSHNKGSELADGSREEGGSSSAGLFLGVLASPATNGLAGWLAPPPKHRRSRWWFQRLLWPRPNYRPGKSGGRFGAMSISNNSSSSRSKSSNSRRRSRKGEDVDDDDGIELLIDQKDKNATRARAATPASATMTARRAQQRKTRAVARGPPAAVHMLRSDDDELADDSEEDALLLGPVAQRATKPSKDGELHHHHHRQGGGGGEDRWSSNFPVANDQQAEEHDDDDRFSSRSSTKRSSRRSRRSRRSRSSSRSRSGSGSESKGRSSRHKGATGTKKGSSNKSTTRLSEVSKNESSRSRSRR